MEVQPSHSEVWIRETLVAYAPSLKRQTGPQSQALFCVSLWQISLHGWSCAHLRIDTTEQSRIPNQSSISQCKMFNASCYYAAISKKKWDWEKSITSPNLFLIVLALQEQQSPTVCKKIWGVIQNQNNTLFHNAETRCRQGNVYMKWILAE